MRICAIENSAHGRLRSSGALSQSLIRVQMNNREHDLFVTKLMPRQEIPNVLLSRPSMAGRRGAAS